MSAETYILFVLFVAPQWLYWQCFRPQTEAFSKRVWKLCVHPGTEEEHYGQH